MLGAPRSVRGFFGTWNASTAACWLKFHKINKQCDDWASCDVLNVAFPCIACQIRISLSMQLDRFQSQSNRLKVSPTQLSCSSGVRPFKGYEKPTNQTNCSRVTCGLIPLLTLRTAKVATPASVQGLAQTASNDTIPSSRAYPFKEIERKWQTYWEANKTFRTPDVVDTTKPKYYVLDMFPYPRWGGCFLLGYQIA